MVRSGEEKKMNYIIIDLEMNPIGKEYKDLWKICRREIIEIGAVVLNETFNEIGYFKTYVQPQYCFGINKETKALTGISDNMITNAPSFSEAIGMFSDWCMSFGDDVQIIQWSENDYKQIRNEMQLKGLIVSERERILLEKWYDLQQEYGAILGLERCVSLQNAVMYTGDNFEGIQHDALFDARNTAALLRTIRSPQKCGEKLGKVIDVLQNKPLGTLGEMFNFDNIQLLA